jgi:chemotaxis protein methyltransferase CheR
MPAFCAPVYQPLESAVSQTPIMPPIVKDIIECTAPESDDRTIHRDLCDIRVLFNAGEWAGAATRCEEFVQKDKTNGEAHFLHALILERLGQHNDSELALRRVIYLDRRYVLAHYCLALRLQSKGDYKSARHSFENVLRLLPNSDETHVFADADGITAADMKRLTQTHLEIIAQHA